VLDMDDGRAGDGERKRPASPREAKCEREGTTSRGSRRRLLCDLSGPGEAGEAGVVLRDDVQASRSHEGPQMRDEWVAVPLRHRPGSQSRHATGG